MAEQNGPGEAAASPFDPAAVTPETAAFNARLHETLSQMPLPFDLPVATVRQARAEGRGVFPLGGPLDGSRWEEAPGPPGRLGLRISDPPGVPRGTYLHIHGGGWTLNAPEQYDRQNQRLAAAAGCRVVSVRYRLAPENRWPAQIEDCLAAARHVLAAGEGPVAIGGESAGAHLAALVLIALRDAGEADRVAGAVLTYGMHDLRLTPSARRWGSRYLVLSTPVIRWFVGQVLDGRDAADPAVSPLLADLAGLPPALLTVGTADPLLDDTLFMAARWQAAGGRAELAVVPGGVHAFDAFDIAIAREHAARQDAFVARCLGQ